MSNPSRAVAVISQIDQLNLELRRQERALSQCLVDLAGDPANAELRQEREQYSVSASRLRSELADLERAKSHALRLDAGSERDSLVGACASKAAKAKELADARVGLAGKIMKTVQMLIDQKKAYDETDEQCHTFFCGALFPLVGHEYFMQKADLQGGRTPVPLFDELIRTLVMHAGSQNPVDAVKWRAAQIDEALDRELRQATRAREAV
jgi:hypothetical protein